MSEQPKQPNNDLKSTVLDRIESEAIVPRSKMWWQCQECLVWVLWGASILFGALSVAVMIFASMHASYALFEATHESPLRFVIEALPFVWIAIFVVMAILGYRNLRNTKRGYRYPYAHILLSSIVFSVGGGAILHFAGVGHILDTGLGRLSPMYHSQAEKELRMWQQPADGRLVGWLDTAEASTTVWIFTDVDKVTWKVETKDLYQPDVRTLKTGKQVRLLGLTSTSAPGMMHACGVFPWMFDKAIKMKDLEAERRDFVDRMYAHKDDAAAREAAIIESAFGDMAMGQCADMPTVRRIGEMMQ